uniref:DUF19 domain-containing protein n=1 Tax=Caenorhabditis japonica TaxID=281687 RepID=A0A8R1E2F9_CAEJA
MRNLLIIFSLLTIFGSNYSSAYFIRSAEIEKCDLGDSIGIILCIAPVTSLLEDNINLMNITRARGIRIVDECRNATTCLSKFPCATKVQLDKIMSLLCDAVSYFSTEFAQCEKKIQKNMPPCMRDVEKVLLSSEKVKDPCELIEKTKTCVETEVTSICGKDMWLPIEKILKKVETYSHMKCT